MLLIQPLQQLVLPYPTLTTSPTDVTHATAQIKTSLAPATPTELHREHSQEKPSNIQDLQSPIYPTISKNCHHPGIPLWFLFRFRQWSCSFQLLKPSPSSDEDEWGGHSFKPPLHHRTCIRQPHSKGACREKIPGSDWLWSSTLISPCQCIQHDWGPLKNQDTTCNCSYCYFKKHVTFNKGEYVGHIEPSPDHLPQTSINSLTTQKMMDEHIQLDTFTPPLHTLPDDVRMSLNQLLETFKSQFPQDETCTGTTHLSKIQIDTGKLWTCLAEAKPHSYETLWLGKKWNKQAPLMHN